MNMIVNTSDLVGYEAETQIKANNKNALAKLLKAWESKQAKKAKTVGGFGLLAVSLAACNTSSDDATTTTSTTSTTTTTTTPATPAAETFILTTAPQALVGGAGNDTFYGLSGASAEAATDTLGAADSVDGGAGTDTFFVTNTATNSGTLGESMVQNVEIFNIRATAGTSTFDATLVSGETAVNAYLATGTVTITGLASGATAGITGNSNVTNGAFNAGWGATVTSATVNIDGGSTAGAVTLSGTGLTTMTVNSTGAKNTVGAVALPGTTTTLTIDAATNLTTGALTNTGGAAMTSLTIKGAGAVNLSTNALQATVKTITASDNSGGVTLTMPTLVTASMTGGSGADTITSNSVLTTGSVNAGDGTDVLILGGVTHVASAALGAKYTNFETLRVGNFSQDVSLVSGITQLQLSLGAVSGADTISKISPAQASAGIVFIDDAQSPTLAMTAADAAGSGDALKMIMGTGLTTGEATDIAGTMVISGFESLTVEQNQGPLATTDGLKTTTIAAMTAANLTSTTLKGHIYTITDAATTLANAIDGSALTGALTVGGNMIAGSSVTGGAGNDSFTASTNNGISYIGNAGNDTFKATIAQLVSTGANDHSFAGGAGTDVLNVTTTTDTTLTDNHFMGITGIETLTLGSTNDVDITGGSAFNTMVDGKVTITDGATVATKTITYALGLATDDITITTGTDQTGATTENVAITTGSGSDTVSYEPGASHVGVTGNGSSVRISTNAGNDSITVDTGNMKAQTNTDAIIITPGTGADTVTLDAGTRSTTAMSVSEIVIASGDSTTTAWDTITNFTVGTAANFADSLDVAGTAAVGTLGTSTDFGTIKSHDIANAGSGIATFDDASVHATALVIGATNIADVAGYLAANTATDDAIAFAYDSTADGAADSTMVYSNQASDIFVLLSGLTGVDLIQIAHGSGANDITIM